MITSHAPGVATKADDAGTLVSRNRIVTTVLDHIRDGKSAFLVGAAGIGKTAILHAVIARARALSGARDPIYCAQTSTMKIMLRCIAEELLARETNRPIPGLQRSASIRSTRPLAIPQNLATLTIGELRQIVTPRLRSGRHAVLLDHVQPLRAACASFLEHLVENRGIPIVAAVRSSCPRAIGKLWYLGLTFATIEVPTLRPAESRRLIEEMLDRDGIDLPDRDAFIKRLVSLADGNPRTLTRVCELARSPHYYWGGRTDFRLLLLDLRIHDLRDRIEAEDRIPLRGPVPFRT